jgi:hypothetical protein
VLNDVLQAFVIFAAELTKNNNKNVTSVPTVDSILESFPTNPLTKIHGRPPTTRSTNFATSSSRTLHPSRPVAVEADTATLDSSCRLTTTTTLLANLSTFLSAPPLQPNHPAGATAAQIAEANRQHAENVREWREYNNIQAALRKQLFNAVEDVYVSAIKIRSPATTTSPSTTF